MHLCVSKYIFQSDILITNIFLALLFLFVREIYVNIMKCSGRNYYHFFNEFQYFKIIDFP